MMNINKRELKIISYDFRSKANRLLRSGTDEAVKSIKLFIDYIESIPIIFDYVKTSKREGFNVEKEVEEVARSYGKIIFDLGSNESEEVYTVYNILKYVSDNFQQVYTLGWAYTFDKTFEAKTKAFNQKVTFILIEHISNYLTRIFINMGYDEEERYMITNYNGQINISKDNSTLNATQNVGVKVDELSNIIASIKELLDDSVPKEVKEEIEDGIEGIQSEATKENPNKSILRMSINFLKQSIEKIPTAIKLCENINKLIEYFN